MPLKNYLSESKNIFDKIQRILAEHGASKVMFDYGEGGRLVSITFGIKIGGKDAGFKLPARVENVVRIMYGGEDRYGRPKEITEKQKEQAYRTAWANVRDWIDAQMAMVDTELLAPSWEDLFAFYKTKRNRTMKFIRAILTFIRDDDYCPDFLVRFIDWLRYGILKTDGWE